MVYSAAEERKDTLLLVLKIPVTCQGHRLYVKNCGELERDEPMSFTPSIFSANGILKDFFMVLKPDTHPHSKAKEKSRDNKWCGGTHGRRWLTYISVLQAGLK